MSGPAGAGGTATDGTATGGTAETGEARLKRLRMRSWRRGTKEMDLVLGRFADAALAGMTDDELTLYDRLLEENDQDLYEWVTGRATPPFAYLPLLSRIQGHAGSA